MVESIEYNSNSISQIENSQSVKEYIQTREDNQILQSLLTTNYIRTSNLTPTQKLGNIKQNAVVIETTPKQNPPVVVEIDTPVQNTEPTTGGTPSSGGGGGGGYSYNVYDRNMEYATYFEFNIK